MEKFFALPKEKQEKIIEAGYACFARMGYKKASAANIAQRAGISKAMIFHYFGSKKAMYLYLIQVANDELEQMHEENKVPDEADFFSRVLAGLACKERMLQKHPAVIAFLLSVGNENDEEVQEEIRRMICSRKPFQDEFRLSEEDTRRFKDGVRPELVRVLLINYIENVARRTAQNPNFEPEPIMEEIIACVEMLRKNLYREEE